jgi:tape measure domain-containing protein
MPSKTVSPVDIVLKVSGSEKLQKLNSSFRDLSKQLNKLSAGDLQKATDDVRKFAAEAGNSEATIKGQIKAFEGLREQAAMGGKVYRELGTDIQNLKASLRGSSDAVERKRSSLVNLGSASKKSAKDLQYVIAQLEKLKSKVKEDSVAFLQLGKDIKNLNVSLKEVAISSSKARFAINTIISAKPEKITGQIEKLNASIASGTLNTEELNVALRKLELLRVGAERGPIAFRANVFSSELGVDYFARLKKEYGNLEKTQATISQRISEVNQELANVTGYERRRALTVELIQLNKDLQNAIVNVTTKEQFQAMAIRQRMGGARESYSQSGFGAFSASIRQRSAAGEFTPGMRRAKERARNQIVDEGAVTEATKLFRVWSEAYEKTEQAARKHKSEMLRIQAEKNKLLIEQQDGASDKLIRKNAEAFDNELALFDQKLASKDRGRQRTGAIKSMLGLSGVDLSPLYEGIVGIGSSRQKGQQARMGRTSQGALSDIINVFNSDLQRTGDGFLDSEKKLRESAIEFAGGSKKVRQRFEKIALGKTPASMFPQTGESSSQYKKRLEGFSLGIKSFIDNLKKTGNGFLESEKNLRNAAIKFSGDSRDVAEAFRNVPLGETPTSMLPGSKETPGSYIDRIRGFSDPKVPEFSSFRKGTIRELNLVKQSLEELRLDLDPLAVTAKETERKITKSIRNVDKELEKRSRTRRKFSPGKAAQVAGATISGGIFGGPEGFLGGAIGGAIGGVGGSFAGAALGAQVGQLRQQLGGFAEYAASIEKLKIALDGIAGDASNYNRALQAAADVTKELNIPQEVAIRGITRLTAAVKGAGGGIADAELAFKNINSAIIATGGGAEQVEGAVTALVQIFSKGKVSAEEINQIAERLPGTFNKIAEASGRTGPELTKALQKGEVGLNDLMKFLVQLGGEYGELAEKIAGSSESAGARLTVAYNKMRIGIGKALQPIGAEFQEAFADFVENITPTLVATLPRLGAIFLEVAKNLDVLAAAATAAGLAMGIIAAKAAVIKAQGIVALFKGIQASATAAGVAVKGLSAAVLINPWVLLAAGVTAATVGVVKYYQGQKELNELLDEGKGSTETIKAKMQEYRDEITKATAKLKGINGEQKATGRQANALKTKIAELRSELDRLDGTYKIRIKFESKGFKFDDKGEMVEFTSGGIVYGGPKGARAKALRRVDGTPLEGLTDYGSPGDEDDKGKDKGIGKVRKSQLPQLQDKYDSLIRSGPLADIQRFQIANSLALVRAQKDNNTELVYTIKNNAINLDFGEKELELTNKYLDAMNAANKTEDIAERQLQERIAGLERDLGLEKLIVSANGELLALKQDQAIASEIIAKASEDELFNLRDQLGLVSNEQRIERFRQSRIDAGDPNAEQQTDLFRQTIDPTLTEGLSQNIRSLKKELEDLVNPINQITGAANAIGSAFSQSFTDAISGSKSAKEALADFFKSVGSYFLDMAGQIIAKMVTMAILNQFVKLLPGSASAPSFGSGVDSGLPLFGDYSGLSGTPFEKGGVLADNEIVPFAKGGIVGSPTIFPLANGTGLMGEAGPEAIMPLKRGPSGRLGVEVASTREQLNNQQAATSTREQLDRQRAVASTREQLNNQQAKAMQPLDIRYESTVINNVEYVTAEQHRQGMAQAAERGRSLTLSALQGSVKTRKKVGLS